MHRFAAIVAIALTACSPTEPRGDLHTFTSNSAGFDTHSLYYDSGSELIVGDLVHHGAHAWLEGGIADGAPRPDLDAWAAALDELRAWSLPPEQAAWIPANMRHRVRDGEAQVTEVGLAVDFTSSTAFSRAFTPFVGETPSAWRRWHAPAG